MKLTKKPSSRTRPKRNTPSASGDSLPSFSQSSHILKTNPSQKGHGSGISPLRQPQAARALEGNAPRSAWALRDRAVPGTRLRTYRDPTIPRSPPPGPAARSSAAPLPPAALLAGCEIRARCHWASRSPFHLFIGQSLCPSVQRNWA